MKKELQGVILVSLAATLWGFDSIALTPRLFHLQVPYVVFMLHFLPFIGMSLLFGREEFQKIKQLNSHDLFYFFLVALFGGAVGTLSIVKALFLVNFQHLTVVTLLQKLQPVFAIILARILLKEIIEKKFIFWSCVALLGGYFLTFEGNLPTMSGSNIGLACFYSLLAAFSFGSATVFGKRILKNASFRTALYLRYSFTTVIAFWITLFTGGFQSFSQTTGAEWLIFVIIGLTTGSGAILLYYYGLRYIPARISTICELCFPISSVVFDFLLNGKLLSVIQLLSAAIMLVAIYRITQKQK
ncbi:DMT family transporter [Fusobacterium necrophorum subsp. funduliforme]|nr:DMT family transporter [Fusobacterium necrophorum]